MPDQLVGIDLAHLQRDLPAGDACQVEHIVDQMRFELYVPADDLQQRRHIAGHYVFLQRLYCREHRCQWSAQLVAECGKELILRPTGGFSSVHGGDQLHLGLFPVGDVAGDAERFDHHPVLEARAAAELACAVTTVGGDDAQLVWLRRSSGDHFHEQFDRLRKILGMHKRMELPADPLLAAPSGESFEGGIECGYRGVFGRE